MKLILIIRSLLSLICGNTLFIFSKSAVIFVVIVMSYVLVLYIKYYLIKIVFPEIYWPNYYLHLSLWKLQSSSISYSHLLAHNWCTQSHSLYSPSTVSPNIFYYDWWFLYLLIFYTNYLIILLHYTLWWERLCIFFSWPLTG